MTLPCPSPRPGIRTGSRFVPAAENKRYLPFPDAEAPKFFFDVVKARRSTRVLYSLSETRLGSVLWHAARVLQISVPAQERQLRKGPFPSAGGLQSQNILVQPSPELLLFYDPVAHSLASLVDCTSTALQLFEAANAVVPAPDATILWLAGDQALISEFYENGESLLWRDSGCISATIALVAEAMGIGTCILGISGEPHLSRHFLGRLAGFGTLFVGEKAPAHSPFG